MNIEEEIFEGSKPYFDKLLVYGFQKEKDKYIFKKLINRNKFEVIITINEDGKVNGKIVDLALDEEYLNFRIENIDGAFANFIKEEYESILNDIKEKCFAYKLKINSWIIPANPRLFDVISYFCNNNTITWHQSINANINDFVYIYLGNPYSCIMFKCKVVKANFVGFGKNKMEKCMELQLVTKYEKGDYPLDFLKKCGLTTVRCARKMPELLSDYLNIN